MSTVDYIEIKPVNYFFLSWLLMADDDGDVMIVCHIVYVCVIFSLWGTNFQVLEHVRLPLLSPKFLVGTVGSDLLIKSDEVKFICFLSYTFHSCLLRFFRIQIHWLQILNFWHIDPVSSYSATVCSKTHDLDW